MKITRRRLKRIIKEELNYVLMEQQDETVEAVPDGASKLMSNRQYELWSHGDDLYIKMLPNGPILKKLMSDLGI